MGIEFLLQFGPLPFGRFPLLRGHRTMSLFGKILRIDVDHGFPGYAIPQDNPFVGRSDARPEIFAFGVRNPQGLFVDETGVIWEHEHGPRGGDELNVIVRGHNYGWPLVSLGRYGVPRSGTARGRAPWSATRAGQPDRRPGRR